MSNLGVIEYRCISSVLYEYLRDGATLVRNRIKMNHSLIRLVSKLVVFQKLEHLQVVMQHLVQNHPIKVIGILEMFMLFNYWDGNVGY